jgi:Na+/alanine symporter
VDKLKVHAIAVLVGAGAVFWLWLVYVLYPAVVS